MKIGLYFGTFNPIHSGHLIIANTILQQTDLKKIWFVVSPQNPLKEKSDLLNHRHRLEMVNLAIEGNENFSACDVEFRLPVPSFTIDTLGFLRKKFPQHEFSIIMGSDNLEGIHLWKNYEELIADYKFFVYRRGKFDEAKWKSKSNIHILDVPLLNISSTHIRNLLKEKKSAQYLLPDAVWKFVSETNLYRK